VVLMPGDHAYRCGGCAGQGASRGVTLSGEAVSFLRASGTLAPARLDTIPVSSQALRELEAVHRSLIARHLEKELKSVRVLRELRGPS
jgi:hypothetical protein